MSAKAKKWAPKTCASCGAIFHKKPSQSATTWTEQVRFCSHACKVEAQTGAPSKKRGNKYPTGRLQMIPCRICGNPTRYHGTPAHPHYHMVHCDNPSCVDASRIVKNDRLRTSHQNFPREQRQEWAKDAWSEVPRVSTQEDAIAPWLVERGWIRQYDFTTRLPNGDHPRWFRFDFADPAGKRYIEIDGSVHRFPERAARDVRKDAIMAEKGWKCLRIPAELIKPGLKEAIRLIENWMFRGILAPR